jgi:hypothetical protein
VSTTESAVASYGQWLFANLFAGETQPVLDADPDHPVWRGLIEAKGSHNTGIARGTLVATLRIAALDKRLADGAWSSLSYSHKVALLPLGEPKALRAAARHVLAASLSVRDAREYVGNLRNPEGAQLRLTPGAARGAIRRLATSFARPRYVQKLETQLGRLEGEERDGGARRLSATQPRARRAGSLRASATRPRCERVRDPRRRRSPARGRRPRGTLSACVTPSFASAPSMRSMRETVTRCDATTPISRAVSVSRPCSVCTVARASMTRWTRRTIIAATARSSMSCTSSLSVERATTAALLEDSRTSARSS